MLAHARTQLALLHDIPESEIPDPVVGAYGDWGRDPFGGGWNFWNPRVDVHDVMTAVKTPLGPDRRVYIVGDSYSGAQGWVEGALTTTEVTLQEHLGLARPDWLPVDYYLGW
jgi:monoamine oxidase